MLTSGESPPYRLECLGRDLEEEREDQCPVLVRDGHENDSAKEKTG